TVRNLKRDRKYLPFQLNNDSKMIEIDRTSSITKNLIAAILN
ncbi:MAG: hypothetical protein ACI8RD_006340, partial [Bacillariaceae sp.]